MAQGLFGTGIAPAQLTQTRIQPAGTPGSTFVRPQQVQTGGNLRALSDALGSLNNSLQQYAATTDRINDDPESLANKEWVARRQQMTREELVAEAEAGTDHGIRARKDALDGLLGERANADFRTQWATYYNTEFDRSSGDATGEYNRMREEFAAGLPSEIARGNFYRLTDPHLQTVVANDTEEKLTTVKGQINATIVDSWHVQIGDAVAAGETDPAKIAQAVIDGSSTNSTFYGLSGQEQIETVWALAERMAMEGKPEIAKAILDAPRKAPDGSVLPAISSLGGYATKAASIVAQGEQKRNEAADATSFPVRLDVDRAVVMGEFTAEDAEALPPELYSPAQKAALVTRSEANRNSILTRTSDESHKRALAYHADSAKADVRSNVLTLMGEQGGSFKIRDVEVPTANGGVTTYSRSDQIKDATAYMESRWADQEAALAEKSGDPAAAKREMQGVRLAWYESNNVHNQTWSDMFSGLPVAANADVISKNPEAAKTFIETAELYRDLKARNGAYAETLIDGPERMFLDNYTMAREFNRMTPEDALAYAAGWQAKPMSEKAAVALPAQEADRIVIDVLDEIGADSIGVSGGIVRDKLLSMNALGMPPEAIKRNLTAWAKDSTYVINGMAMPAQRDLPQDFPILADMELDRVFAERGEALGIESSDDLFLQPVSGETKWQVWSKAIGGPVGNVYVTQQTLDTQRTVVAEERSARQAELIAAANEDKAAKRQEFDDYVAYEQERINAWSKQGKLGAWAAEGWQADLDEFIQSADPAFVANQKAERQAQERTEARWLAARLGFNDPFPEDGKLPPDPYYAD